MGEYPLSFAIFSEEKANLMIAWRARSLCRRCRRRDCPGDVYQFLATGARRAWLCQPGFVAFYVRQSILAPLLSAPSRPTIELANLRAASPGQGTFKRLARELLSAYPMSYLFVESVLSERFRKGLLRMGFRAADQEGCYFVAAEYLK